MKSEKKRIDVKTLIMTVLAAAVVITVFLWRSEAARPICSAHNDAIEMNKSINEISQTWEASTKNISGITLYPVKGSNTDLKGSAVVSVKCGENQLCRVDVPLSEFEGKDSVYIKTRKLKLDLGERYTLHISLKDIADDTKITLQTNADYGGLTKYSNGNEIKDNTETIKGALAADIMYERSSNAAWFLKLILVFGAFSLLFALLFNRSTVETIAMSTASVFIILYFFGIFGGLAIGVNAVIVFAAVFMVLAPYIAQQKDRNLRSLITPGTVAYIILLAIYFLLDRNAVSAKVDDLNQWQTCVRDMWFSDSYPFHKGSFLAFPRYPSGMGTLEYFITYLYGDYREGIVLFACHSIGFAFLSILYSGISWKECHKVIPVTAVIASLPILVYQSHYGIMYVDAYLGIIGAYLFIIYFTENEQSLYKVVSIVLGAAFLSMVKESGFVMAGIMFMIILIDLWYHDSNHSFRKLVRDKYTKRYFICALAVIMFFVSWEIFCTVNGASNGLTMVFRSITSQVKQISYSVSSSLLASAGGNTMMQDGILRYANGKAVVTPMIVIHALGAYIVKNRDYNGFSYAGIIVLFAAVCELLRLSGLFKKIDLRMRAVIIYTTFGSVMYALFMAVCYIYMFAEDSPIPAVRRYMGTYLLVFMISVIGVMIVAGNRAESNGGWRQQIAWLLGICVILNVPKDHPYRTGSDVMGDYYTIWQDHQSIGEVFRSFARSDEKIYYVAYKDSRMVSQYDYLIFFNAVAPNNTQGLGAGWKPVEEIPDDNGQYYVKMSPDEWSELLSKDYKYVYLQNVNVSFKEQYGSLFENEDDIKDGGIYRVVKSSTGIKLSETAYMNLD